MKPNLRESILKIQKVIESCITLDHVQATKNLVTNFAHVFSQPAGKRFGEQLYTFDPGAADAYNELWLATKEKEQELL